MRICQNAEGYMVRKRVGTPVSEFCKYFQSK